MNINMATAIRQAMTDLRSKFDDIAGSVHEAVEQNAPWPAPAMASNITRNNVTAVTEEVTHIMTSALIIRSAP